jgi:rhamnosyltransferase subunit B
MDVLILTIGSAGDVHPFVGIATALVRRGHRVRVATNPYVGKPVVDAGLELIPLGDEAEFADALKDPSLWHHRRGIKFVFDMVLTGLRRTYDAVAANVTRDSVVVSSSLAFGARIAQDKIGFKMATVHLSPSQFRSSTAPPKLAGLWMPRWMPLWARKKIWEGGDKYVLDPILAGRINELRAELGLPPVTRILDQWWNSPDRVIGLFPGWFGPPQTDWWPQSVITGFPRYDESTTRPGDPQLEAFLAAGEPPIVFTPGSAMAHGTDFLKTGVEICRRLNRRGLLLTRYTAHLPANLPPTVRTFSYAPFSTLFPRCAAVVHHGGIGTTAQALAAGVPQLVTPFAHDQFDNGFRVTTLGVGRSVPANKYRPRSAGLLAAVIADCADRSKRVAKNFDGDRSMDRTCQVIESLAGEDGPASSGPRTSGSSGPRTSPSGAK